MKSKQLKEEKGFTIIEVLIVLAIAGLIMLVVFLAVPALQRNSRNTQRTSDVSLISSAVNECLNNRNGRIASCNTTAQISPTYIDASATGTTLRQLRTIVFSTSFPADNAAIAHVAMGTGTTPGWKCTADGGDVTQTGASPRAIAVLYKTEGTAGQNIQRCLDI